MKYMRASAILIFLLAIPGFMFTGCDTFVRETPDKQMVQTALDELREQKTKQIEGQLLNNALTEHIGTWLSDNSLILKILLISVGSTAVLLAAFFVIRMLSTRIHTKTSREIIRDMYADLQVDPAKLDQLIHQGEFSKAVCYLHNATILVLITEKILRVKNMTNQMVTKSIKNDGRQRAFRRIADISERILFDNESASEEEFLECQALFRDNYLSGGPK